MKNKLIIVGAGGCGREVAQIAKDVMHRDQVAWVLHGFIDDNLSVLDDYEYDIPLLGRIDSWEPKQDEVFVCAIGNPELREKLTIKLEEKRAEFICLIHPTAVVSFNAEYQKGLVVYPFCSMSVDTKIGKHVIINMHNSIGHDAKIGNYSVLSSYCDITGFVELGNKVFLGSHVTIAPGLKIGDNANIGLGSVVVANIKNNKRVFGNPARTLKL